MYRSLLESIVTRQADPSEPGDPGRRHEPGSARAIGRRCLFGRGERWRKATPRIHPNSLTVPEEMEREIQKACVY